MKCESTSIMGYSLTIRSVRKVEQYLKVLSKATSSVEWTAVDKNAKKLVYQLQEGINASEHLGLKQYAGLRKNWKFKLKGSKVIAEYQLDIDQIPSQLTFTQTDTFDIIEILVRQKPMQFDLLFPNASVDELITDYCAAHNYEITKLDSGILFKRVQDDNASV